MGVITLSALLAILGGASLVGGLYLGLTGATAWPAWLTALVVGPVALYLAVRLLTLTRWAWLALVVLCTLLLVSSCARLLLLPGLYVAPVAELLVEVGVLVYLWRPAVRAAFRRA